MTARWMVAMLALSMTACSGTDGGDAGAASDIGTAPAGGAVAIAELRTAVGTPAGRVRATESAGTIRVTIEAKGLPPGAHGVHVHTTGLCEGPKFESAGPHWNPTSRQHGTDNPQGSHAGDLPNLTIAADGSGTLDMALPAGTMAGLLDADGAAFLVHAKADDLKTDPSGASGDRIACGVFAAG